VVFTLAPPATAKRDMLNELPIANAKAMIQSRYIL
jgi:hypothetical protein